MAEEQAKPIGPDLAQGVDLDALPDGGKISGHVGDQEVLLVRRGTVVFAVGAHCTHYHAPLGDGLVVEDTLRCPWHHACFSLRTGEALHAPAFDPLGSWSVEQRDGKVFVGEKRDAPRSAPRGNIGKPPGRIIIVGGGAAGFAAAERLRREQYAGSIVILSDDDVGPVDRPNLSKDYLAGKAPVEWIPLRPESFYSENKIDLRLNTHVTSIDVRARKLVLASGDKLPYDCLLLATGAAPIRPSIPGADLAHVHTLRSLGDCRAIVERAKTARRAVVLGASFIGLEVAASLSTRGLQVHVVAPERLPMERIFGAQLGEFVRSLHEKHGIVFHLEETATAISDDHVRLSSGGTLKAELVVAGIGVRPRIELAERAGLSIDRGVLVNSYLETSVPGIFAAGDIARWADPRNGENLRIEHWVVAERQGQVAALNMLGYRQKFSAIPFFWSQHYDIPINYVGYAEKWDELVIEGNLANNDCMARYKRGGRVLAVASIFRDIESLEAELAMELEVAQKERSLARRVNWDRLLSSLQAGLIAPAMPRGFLNRLLYGAV